MSKYSYIGKGMIYVAKRTGGIMGAVGNCSRLELNTAVDSLELPDYTQPGGGLDDSLDRVTSVEAAMTLHNLSPENLARHLSGSVSAVTAGAVSAEGHPTYKGGLVVLNNLPNTTLTITVEPAGGGTPFVEGDDYIVTPTGLLIPEGSSIDDSTAGEYTIEVDYTKLASDVIELLSAAPDEYRLHFAGLNEAKSGVPAVIDIHRIKFGPAASYSAIGEGFAGLEVTGKLLLDSTVTGSGLSKFARIRMGVPA